MSKATHVTLLDPASREFIPHVLVEGPHGTQVHRYDRGGPLVLILGAACARQGVMGSTYSAHSRLVPFGEGAMRAAMEPARLWCRP